MIEIALRSLLREDLPTRVRWFNDPRVAPTMVLPVPITLESTTAWFEGLSNRPERHDWAALDVETGDLMGFIGVRPVGPRQLQEIYIVANPDRHGQGIGTEMIRLAVENLIQVSGTEELYAEMYRSNPGVIRAFEKNGFRESFAPRNPDRIRLRLDSGAA